ncbi:MULTISPECIES: amidohydrolase [Bradyrhizobium]|uniref:Amidohydrolase n=1 Tax=Bradyrhizobium yuanmingense TaxID=108015 RepID=A0A1C3X3B2_9BRAD|nr:MULTISPECIES: amidohydrolase [Bradyrhizobium]MCA1380606.1 amidohydrolase [Bradyrhizobium sp. BRP05]MCA1419273.1 amidohydrolase [Bradyrhizobium sp. BRP23]PWE79400.1 peptidase M20 [Bradyrhizobium sp. SUTN9-2]TWI22579.1 amidohydrolase [Bradyrhizobium yuanmingense]SCB46719.1 amidohydrolase [Bradyrhizobium yuanmingense]
MFLTENDLNELVTWRRHLHAVPELSGQEAKTAEAVRARLQAAGADRIVSGLGGHGVLGIYDGRESGPTIMLRAELDALPIQEKSELKHRSLIAGKAHLCGHDGHMAILAAVAQNLSQQRPSRGRVALLFQPAEEDGSGAAAVLADAKFEQVRPDFVFALHNLPGLGLGQVSLAEGLVNCASQGMQIRLSGRTTHASNPALGISPKDALARLLLEIPALGRGTELDDDFSMLTVTHARLGEPAFGIAPGFGELWATLRTCTDMMMERLRLEAEDLVRRVTAGEGLSTEIAYRDVFNHCANDVDAVAQLRSALDAEGVRHSAEGLPLRGSEDFGRFGSRSKSAMFFLGAGKEHPGLHESNYDFPDQLIEIGARIFVRTIRNLLG